jgi:hypothetical protein
VGGGRLLPGDAVEAAEAGMTLAEATAWRNVGFIVPDAALLVRDGWTLDEATVARFAGVDRYPPASRIMEASVQIGDWEMHPPPDADQAGLTQRLRGRKW